MSNRKRQAISLETKIKILDCLKRGGRPTSVGKSFGFNEATIRTMHYTLAVCCGVRGRGWPNTPMSVGSNPSAAVDCLP